MVANRLEKSQWDFVMEHDEAIRRVVQRTIGRCPNTLHRHSFDDLLQEARAAACAALATYCERSSKATRECYVFGCVKFALLRYAAQSRREFATPEDMAEEIQDSPSPSPILDSLLKKLTKDERRLIVLRYGLEGNYPHSTREVAKEFKVSHPAIISRQQRIEATMAYMAKQLTPPPPPAP